jgi:hypothetical protein
MSGTIDPNDWRTWPRKGNYIEAPDGSPMEQRFAAMWALTCEEYGHRSRQPAAVAEGHCPDHPPSREVTGGRT